ncbi:DinB family protein [Niabella yanshanensis]|uniref:DinB family protein n=1 Tax=Niabella yanshanensis TaxID=577386 RepID=A0ABZ0W7S9_9BACT|nr:DinB family protein [Niabella yanshanensis]WQD39338.1 DinB family protein [Niabella yanshanensis]
MKQLFFIAALVTLFSFTIADPISDKDRKDLLSYRKSAATSLLSAVKDLSEAQRNWKANDSSWSIANCIEHITLTEKSIFDWAMATLKEPADASKSAEIKNTDEQIKAMIESRDHKAKAPEPLKPIGKLGNTEKALKTFEKQSSGLSEYIQNTSDDLRHHYAQTPVGTVDAYQLLLFLTAHTKRHTAQILAIKADPAFPK